MSLTRSVRDGLSVSSLMLAVQSADVLRRGRHRRQPSSPSVTPTPLSAAEVQQVVQDAAQSANAPLVIAVADRAGKILAVFRNAGAPRDLHRQFRSHRR